jgi:hypothetical protein
MSEKAGMEAIAIKVSRWALFGVIIALIPLVFAYLNLMIKLDTPTVTRVLGNGELLIVVAAMCAGALGEVIGTGSEFRFAKILSAGFTLVILILAALVFASVAEARAANEHLTDDIVKIASVSLFVFGLFSCGTCIALSEL